MKLPGLLALGRSFAKAPDRVPMRLEAARPGLQTARPAGAARPTRASGPAGPPLARVSASPAIPVVQLPAATRAAGGTEAEAIRPVNTGGNGSSATGAVTPGFGPDSARSQWGGWWRRRRSPPPRELRLASVRVVRNDLCTDDLELIPRPSPAARGLKLGVERAVPSGGWRGWLAHWAHLLGLRRERHP